MLELGLRGVGSYWKDLSHLLPDIPSRIRSIALYVTFKRRPPDMAREDESLSDCPPIEANGLGLLDPVLQGDNFQSLERVEFKVHRPTSRTIWRACRRASSRWFSASSRLSSLGVSRWRLVWI